ncbi:MAG: preprotein translocase subunit SecE [Solirubrobacteraceae bacterium]
MARDRERAKRRRAERRARGEAAGAPLGEGTPTPDPLEHSSAEVDEALLAEAGATPPDVGGHEGELGPGVYEDELHGDDEEYERADDAVEGDVVSRRDLERAEAGHPHRRRGRVITFLGHCIDELRRVQWPDRRQVGQATAVVLGFVVIAGGYLGLLDALWQPLIDAIL